MISFRKLLFPFSVVYDAVTQLRNIAFDQSWKEQISFDIPIICVGNLSVGGTGKTPQIEYLIRLLEPQFRVVTLSRGYKRKTTGFYLADKTSRMEDIGDEPYQYLPNLKIYM
ncbi:tetraacyldisaccharide 4'-kinase [Paenimyroides ceti]|uniref:tetraacyldisaccharide 4'-kinase n=1 Tax=Paenimyroides ceti TaxID=395087 RepID=UPI00295007E2|nr:tetraacyldisaccharide 4'-kinase [Paenimyroides ceti]